MCGRNDPHRYTTRCVNEKNGIARISIYQSKTAKGVASTGKYETITQVSTLHLSTAGNAHRGWKERIELTRIHDEVSYILPTRSHKVRVQVLNGAVRVR